MAQVSDASSDRPWLAALRALVPRLRLITVGVRTIALHRGQVVLVRHRFHDRERWYLPGGGVDNGEGAAEAALRETEEEAGIPRDSLRIRSVSVVFLNELTGWDDHVIVFAADASAPPNTSPLAWEPVE